MGKLLSYDAENPSEAVFRVILFNAIAITGFGLFVEGPAAAFQGLMNIFTSPAILVTDYIHHGGLGGAFLNSGLAMLFALMVTRLSKASFGGSNVGAEFIVAGFALFGKTLPNMIPIVFGTFIYAKLKKEPFKNHVNTGLFATCLGPFVHHLALYGHTSLIPRFIIAVALGILIGILVPIVAGLTSKLHDGMLIFNAGLASGFVGTVIVAVLKSFGWEFESVSLWTTGNDKVLGIFLSILFVLMIVSGISMGGLKNLGKIMKHSGQAPTDYTRLEGLPATLINMGICGFMAMGYVLIVGGNLNGPTIAGILSVCGFAAFGMNYYNIIWGVLGIVILSFGSVWTLDQSGILLAALFCTCICTIAGKYGPIWGIISGMLHVSVVRNAAVNYGWLNLYNNGYAAGIVCIVLLPVIAFVNGLIQKKKAESSEAKTE